MTILHTVNKSAASHPALEQCLATMQADSALLLIENGVLNAINEGLKADQLALLAAQKRLYVLEVDAIARGITQRLLPNTLLVNDSEFVRLCTVFDATQSWY
ncbi:sulfurtransferase complex subunit TusB [Zooshikella marina]|uniref:sulfurtransferase complex subunit TusB n=1 Tax=Zooshikella ganghwensis TaxID=202772 RepID=UPI001BB026D3|nr:sulfurtransferase complex subunit TusB [Zooshikella ganghwensis]MBU2705083.1 sulfurtransferase complex subunit TusB [Zooshikella ganghwensis]